MLLQNYAENKKDFRDPKIKKKTVWEKIQQAFTSKDLNVTTDMLDRKMRNLKHSFKLIKDNNKKSTTGRGRIQWEWYEIMEDIFLEDRTINTGHTLSSLPPTSQESLSATETYNGNINTEIMEVETAAGIEQPETSSTSRSEENNDLDRFLNYLNIKKYILINLFYAINLIIIIIALSRRKQFQYHTIGY